MPNVGRPSRDCHACRQRRTKCDLLRPHCTPCLRKGIPCPGYRDEVDVLFRTNTFSAFQSSYRTNKGKNRERRTKKDSLGKSSDVSLASSSSSTGSSSSSGGGDSPERKEDDNTNHPITQNEGYSSLTAYIPFRIPGTVRDQQLLHYYCATTSQALSHYPKTGFWTSTVLQWSAHEPVIRRCMIAYSSSHRQYNPSRGCSSSDLCGITSGCSSDDDYSLQIMPLLEYNNALRLLRQYIVTAPVPRYSREVILISIAILYGAARSIGKLEDAKTHLRAASEILNSWMKSEQRSGQASRSSDGLASLLEIFSKISLQATLFDDILPSSYLNDSETEDTTTMTFGPMISIQFQNAIEAQHALETTQSRFFRFIVVNRKPDCHAPPLAVTTTDDNLNFPSFVYTEIATLEKQVAFWRSSFQEIRDTSSYNQPNGARGPVRYHTALLYAQYWTLSTLIRSSMQLLNGRQPSSPELNAHAERVLLLLKTNFIFPSPQAETKEEAQLEKIICKPSATPQLYLELAQQRDFAMQSKAIELLTDTLNHEDMANVFRVLNLLMAIGRKECHPFYNYQDHTKDLVAAQRELERLVQVLDERMG